MDNKESSKQIRSILAKYGYSLTDVVSILNEKNDNNDTLQNISNKLRKGTFRYNEAAEIAEALDLEIIWIPKNATIKDLINPPTNK